MDKHMEFSNLEIRLRFFVSSDIRNVEGKRIGTIGIQEYKTKSGVIEAEKWYEQAYKLIEKYNELEILEDLKKYTKENCSWLQKADDKKITEYALELHIRRIFEKHEWVGYEKFIEMRGHKEQLSLFCNCGPMSI